MHMTCTYTSCTSTKEHYSTCVYTCTYTCTSTCTILHMCTCTCKSLPLHVTLN